MMIFRPGTSKASEPYKVGKRITDILLEILNLNKTEIVSIDIISNQEFTEVIQCISFTTLLLFGCSVERSGSQVGCTNFLINYLAL